MQTASFQEFHDSFGTYFENILTTGNALIVEMDNGTQIYVGKYDTRETPEDNAECDDSNSHPTDA